MADIQVPSIAVATPAAADTVLGVQGGAVKRFAISALPFTQTGTGAVARTVEAKLRDTVSVKDFGATGNGTTDDAAAIQAAIDSVAGGGGTVFVPAGVFVCGSTISIKSNVWLRGAGIGLTGLKLADGANVDLIRNPNNAYGVDGPDTGIVISDMTLDGNKANQTGDEPSGDLFLANIRLKNTERCGVSNVYSHSSRGYGLEFKASVGCFASQCYFTNCGDDGLSVSDTGSGASQSKHIAIDSCFSWGNAPDHEQDTGSGFEVDDGPTDVSFTNCHAWGNYAGIYVHAHPGEVDPAGVSIVGGTFSDNVLFGVYVTGAVLCEGISVQGAICRNNTVDGVRAIKASKVTVSGVVSIGNGARGIHFSGVADSDISGCISADNLTPDGSGQNLLYNCQRVQWRGGSVSGALDTGLMVSNSSDCVVEGVNFYDNTVTSLKLITESAGSASNNTIRGNVFRPGAGMTRAIWLVDAAVSGTVVEGNDLRATWGGTTISNGSTSPIIRRNPGHVTENSGSGSIASGATSAIITHGLRGTPSAGNIFITFTAQGTNDYGRVWVDAITATQFTVNVSTAPGSALSFGWSASL